MRTRTQAVLALVGVVTLAVARPNGPEHVRPAAPPQAPVLAAASAAPLTLPSPPSSAAQSTTAPPTPTTTTSAPPTTTSPPPTTVPEPEPRSSEPSSTTEPEPEDALQTASEHVPALGGGWEDLRQCESGGDYTAEQPDGPGRGAYQFDQPTWDGVVRRLGRSDLIGMDPAAAAPSDQDEAAAQLYSERGSQPWPYCGTYV